MKGQSVVSLGVLLKGYRLAAALSQEELAGRSGVSVRTISDLERGIRDTARLETVRLLATGLGLTQEDRATLIAASIAGMAADLPKTWSGSLPGNLPAPPNPLIGRDALVREIVGLITNGSSNLLTLTGPGGVGKTRIAIEVASSIAAERKQPVVFVPLAPVSDPRLVPSAIAHALAIPPGGSPPADRVLAVLARRKLLLVLDNFEHLLDASPFVAMIAAGAPDVSLVITSRSRLRLSIEREVPVPPLQIPDQGASTEEISRSGAIQLFSARATDSEGHFALTDDTAGTAAEICRRVDGLPLAIELAASKLRMISAATLLTMLDHRLPVLTGGQRDQPARQQSMRATIEWSYGLLHASDQKLFRWLSTYGGGFSLSAVVLTGASIGRSEAEAIDALDHLLDSGLIERIARPASEPRFRILETIREYGMEQLGKHGELDEARTANAEFIYAYIADGAPPPCASEDNHWLARVDLEEANIVAAFDWICRPETAEWAVQFASAIGFYWEVRGPYVESALRLRRAIGLSPVVPSSSTTHALFWAASLSMYARQFEVARAIGEVALTMARSLGYLRGEAFALSILGWIADVSENWDEAAVFLEQAIAKWKDVDELHPQAQQMMLLGGRAYVQGDYVKARALEEKAMAIFAGRANDVWIAAAHWYLGFIDVAEGKWHDAACRFFHALELWLSDSFSTHLFKPLIHLADVAAAIGDWETAATLVGNCDETLEDSGAFLFPFDVPAWERATQRSRDALGGARFQQLHFEGRALGPAAWLALAEKVVARANPAQPAKDGQFLQSGG
ncbi:MAG: helix-turn-helix domain-containing protein [Thermomicrobiales bacterium]